MTICNIHCHLKYKIVQPTEFVFLIHIAQSSAQTILEEQLTVTPSVEWHQFEDAKYKNRYLRLRVEPCDSFELNYIAKVDRHEVTRPLHTLQTLKEVAISDIPDDVLTYLLPSQYCNTGAMMTMAQRSFGWMPAGYLRVKAIEQWIYNNIAYISGSTDQTTTATDVLIQRAGVCRDFAHLAISFCRALGIPARIVVGYVEIEKFDPDFHAVFEAYLEGGWVLFDATRLAPVENMVRIGTGIDASDVAFATFYGELELLNIAPIIQDAASTD